MVRDAGTRLPLAAVHIIVEGQRRGTITNNGGQFEIVLPSLPAALLIRHIGYETVRLKIGPDDPREFNVDLTEAVYELEEVVVAGDEFAASLMRKVIEQKKRRRAHLTTWHSRGYSRITLQNDSRIVLVSEHVFDAYRDAAGGPREVIRSRRETGSFYSDLGIDPVPPDFSQDYVEIQGLQFVGPTHPEALKHYHFSFAGSRKYAGKDVYDLYVGPKDGLRAAVIGRISVLDSAFALIEADVRPPRHLEYRPAIKLWQVSYRQQFTEVDSFWLPLGLLAEGTIQVDPNDAGIGSAGFRHVALLQGHEINQSLPAAPYAQAKRVTVDEASVLEDDLFLLGRGIVALMPREARALGALARERLKLRDALPAADLPKAPRSIAVSTPDGEQPQFVWPIIWGAEPWLRFNRVDGYFIGGGSAADMGRVSAGGRIAKGTGDNGTRLAARFTRWLSSRFNTTISGGRETAPQQASRIYTMALNSVTSRLGYGDYFDYYWRWWGRARANYVLPKVRIGIGARMESHLKVEQSFKRAWPFNGSFPPNPPVDEQTWYYLEASVAGGDNWQPFRLGPTQRVEIRTEHAFGSGGPSYGRYELWLDTHAKTFLRRRPRPMALSIRAIGKRSWGSLPIQGLVALDGSIGPFATLGALRSLRTARYQGRHAAGFYWEHDFRTVLWEVVGLRPLTTRRTGVALGGAHAQVWPGSRGYHHELTVSLTEVLGSPFRVDLTRRMEAPEWYVSLGLSRMF